MTPPSAIFRSASQKLRFSRIGVPRLDLPRSTRFSYGMMLLDVELVEDGGAELPFELGTDHRTMRAERDENPDVLWRDALELGQEQAAAPRRRRRPRDVVDRDDRRAGAGRQLAQRLRVDRLAHRVGEGSGRQRRPSRMPLTCTEKRAGNGSSSVVSGSQHPHGTVTAAADQSGSARPHGCASLSRYF